MNTRIAYGNYNFNNQPTPFLSRSESFIKAGENWGSAETFTLRGQITGCDFAAVRSGQKDLIAGFGRDFQTLKIFDSDVKFQIGLNFLSGATGIDPDFEILSGIYDGDGATDDVFSNSSGQFILESGIYPSGSMETETGNYIFPAYTGWQIYSGSTVFDINFNISPAPPTENWENGTEFLRYQTELFAKTGIKVESINFESNKYTRILPYEITLTHFPPEYFTTYNGVINPTDSWDFTEGEDGLLSITHNISCKGFNTHSGANNAFENARRFVNSRTGYQNMVNPHFICKNTYPDFYPCLDTFTENINRVNGEYSITENYVSDLEGTGFGVLRYTVDLNSGVDSFSTAQIRGNVDGCKNGDMATVRARFKDFQPFNIVSETYNDAFGFVDLNPEGLSTGIQEDSINKKINFDISYNNDHSPQTILDVQTNVNSGDSHISVTVDGNITARGDIRDRYSKILDIYDGLNIFNYASNAYVEFFGGTPTYPLNPKEESKGVVRNPFAPSLSFNATYTNKEIPPNGFESFQRNASIIPSLRPLKPVPLFDQAGTYDIIDLLFDRRAKLSVSLNGVASPSENSATLTSTMRSEANLMLQTYGTSDSFKLESYNISTGNLGEYNLNATWSFEAANKVYDGVNYDSVNTLKIK